MAAKTIDEVIEQLEEIKQWARTNHAPIAYFVCLYQAVTIGVKRGIEEGRFEDGARMERLDVIFANRFLEAWEAYRGRKACSRSWQVVFDQMNNPRLLILQHLLLGINAHINLDLGIAVVETARERPLEEVSPDFEEINRLLFEMVEEVQGKVGKLSPLFDFFDRLFAKHDERMIRLNLQQARKNAWRVATVLAGLAPEDRPKQIYQEDHTTSILAGIITHLPPSFRIVQWVIQLVESKDVNKVIDLLEE